MLVKSKRPNLVLFYAIAFGFAWLFWVPLALFENGMLALPEAVEQFLNDSSPAAWGPLIAAVIAIALSSGLGGVKDLIKRMFRFRFGFAWYLVCLILIPAIVWFSGIIAEWQGSELPVSEAMANPIAIPIAFLWIFFFGGPLQEEAGWRGVAAEGFQKRTSALVASIIAGVLWGLWHLPLFYVPREEIYYNQPFLGLLASTVMLSVLLVWVYNNTGRSLFAVMLMHTSFNWSNYVFTSLQDDTGGVAYMILMFITVVPVVIIAGPYKLTRSST